MDILDLFQSSWKFKLDCTALRFHLTETHLQKPYFILFYVITFILHFSSITEISMACNGFLGGLTSVPPPRRDALSIRLTD